MRTQRSFQASGIQPTRSRSGAGVTAPAVQSVKQARPKRDWQAYNRQLAARGNVFTFVLDQAVAEKWWVRSGKKGRPAYTRLAIQVCWQVRVWLRLPLRQTQGFLTALFTAAGLPAAMAPEFSTLNKRGRDLNLIVPDLPAGGVILIDGTGISYAGTGEWRDAKWGKKDGRARFVRVTATCDATTGVWTATRVTDDHGKGTGETSQVPGLLTDQPHSPDVLIGDGAYDTKNTYQTAAAHGVTLLVPPMVTATFGLHPDRDVTLQQKRRLGMVEWKKRSGYHTRSLVEADIGAWKTSLGDTTRARTVESARAQVLASMSVHNYWRANELGLNYRIE
jgi:hypothetical protein